MKENEIRLNQLQKELSRLEEDLFTLEICDDWCYSNGNADKLNRKIALLREEIVKEKIALDLQA